MILREPSAVKLYDEKFKTKKNGNVIFVKFLKHSGKKRENAQY